MTTVLVSRSWRI